MSTRCSLYLQGEREHRHVKSHFKCVRKGKHALGIGQRIRRQRLMYRIKERNRKRQQLANNRDNLPTVPFEEDELLPPTSPNQHYHISNNTRQKFQLSLWLRQNKDDPAIEVVFFCQLSIFRLMELVHRTFYRGSRTIYCLDS